MEPPSVEEKALQRLARIGGDRLVRKMIEAFIPGAARRIATARSAAAAGDLAAVEFAMHALKGSAGNLGAFPLLQQAEQIEQAAAAGQGGGLAMQLAALEETYVQVKSALEAFYTRLEP